MTAADGSGLYSREQPGARRRLAADRKRTATNAKLLEVDQQVVHIVCVPSIGHDDDDVARARG